MRLVCKGWCRVIRQHQFWAARRDTYGRRICARAHHTLPKICFVVGNPIRTSLRLGRLVLCVNTSTESRMLLSCSRCAKQNCSVCNTELIAADRALNMSGCKHPVCVTCHMQRRRTATEKQNPLPWTMGNGDDAVNYALLSCVNCVTCIVCGKSHQKSKLKSWTTCSSSSHGKHCNLPTKHHMCVDCVRATCHACKLNFCGVYCSLTHTCGREGCNTLFCCLPADAPTYVCTDCKFHFCRETCNDAHKFTCASCQIPTCTSVLERHYGTLLCERCTPINNQR